MRFVSLLRYLTTTHNYSRKTAVLGARLALGVDALNQLEQAGYYRRRGLQPLYLHDIDEIRKAAEDASSFI